VGSTGESWSRWGWSDGANWGVGNDWLNGSWGSWDGNGGVDVGWSRWLDLNWLGDSAWAVGDGEGGGLSDGVGNIVEGQGGGLWAVGGVGGKDLSNVGNVAVGSDGGHKGGGNGGDGELHVYGWDYLLEK